MSNFWVGIPSVRRNPRIWRKLIVCDQPWYCEKFEVIDYWFEFHFFPPIPHLKSICATSTYRIFMTNETVVHWYVRIILPCAVIASISYFTYWFIRLRNVCIRYCLLGRGSCVLSLARQINPRLRQFHLLFDRFIPVIAFTALLLQKPSHIIKIHSHLFQIHKIFTKQIRNSFFWVPQSLFGKSIKPLL